MSNDQAVRIGFVGLGGNGRGHLHNLEKNPDCNVVGICDVSDAMLQEGAKISSAAQYNDYRKMLDEQQVDAVYLSIPPFTHGEIEFDIIDRGLPFFVEKPVALNLDLAHQISAKVREKNLMTAVGYQLRYFAPSLAVRELLKNSTIGLLSGYYWTGTGRAMVGRWWEWHDKSGGQLTEQATHTVDMMRFLAGEVNEVFCYADQRLLGKDITDCADVTTLLLRFANGAVGTFSCTSALHASDGLANVIDITYDDSRLRWSYLKAEITREGQTTELPGEAQFNSVDDAFVAALKTGDRSLILSDYDEGIRTLALTLAAEESARTGQPVHLKDFNKA